MFDEYTWIDISLLIIGYKNYSTFFKGWVIKHSTFLMFIFLISLFFGWPELITAHMINNLLMFNKILFVPILVVLISAASVPCTQYQASTAGNASDCSITRLDKLSISWGAKINFKTTFNWNKNSYSNVLADTGSPRLPVKPSKSNCTSKEGSYTAGQSVIVNCTQGFDQIPVGYQNLVAAFDNTPTELGFSMKIPLSLIPELFENLQTQWSIR